MALFHHQKLPDASSFLACTNPPDEIAFESQQVFLFYRNEVDDWKEPVSHAHLESEECFIVLRGTIVFMVEGERHVVGPREFCCFPSGVYHAIIETQPPIECVIVRAPIARDKVYLGAESPT